MANVSGAVAPQTKAGSIKEVTTASFRADVLTASVRQPVLVDFWAPWCGPCKQLAPALEKAVSYKQGGKVALVKMNIDDHPQIAGQLGIQSIPAVIAFDKGQPVDGVVRPEGVDQARDAGADGVNQLLIGLRSGGALLAGERGATPSLGRLAAQVIDHDVPQEAVEPGHHRLVVAKRPPARDPARERLLQQLLGQLAPADPPLEKPQEPAAVGDQRADHRGRESGLGLGAVRPILAPR